MAITYPLTMPTNRRPSQVLLSMRNVVGISSSPFTFQSDVFRFPGQAWAAQVSLPVMKRDEAYPWIAFLTALRGRYGTFYLGDPDAEQPLGEARNTPGTPVLDGLQSGEDISVTGLPTSVVGYLLPGDYVQIGTGAGRTLHKVLEQVDSDSSGDAVLTLWPEVRTPTADGTEVVVSNCRGLFRLSQNEVAYDIGTASRYGMSFACEEVL